MYSTKCGSFDYCKLHISAYYLHVVGYILKLLLAFEIWILFIANWLVILILLKVVNIYIEGDGIYWIGFCYVVSSIALRVIPWAAEVYCCGCEALALPQAAS